MKIPFVLGCALSAAVVTLAGESIWKEQLKKSFPRDPQLLRRYDLDSDGDLNAAELARLFEFPPHNLKKFDRDFDGKLSEPEQAQARAENGRLVVVLLRRYDKNGDGAIDKDEMRWYEHDSADPFDFDQVENLNAAELAVLHGTVAHYRSRAASPAQPAGAVTSDRTPVVARYPNPVIHKRYDLDNDSVISASERKFSYQFPPIVFPVCDRDANEFLDEQEQALARKFLQDLRKNLIGLDQNKNGRYDAQEIDFMLTRPRYRHGFDFDSDGKISPEERAAVLALFQSE